MDKILILFALMTTVFCAPHKNDVISAASAVGPAITGCRPGFACVSFNLCLDNNVVKDGVGLIDARFDEDETPRECLHFHEICCQLYDKSERQSTTTRAPAKDFEKCGERNADLLNLKVIGEKNAESSFGEFPWMVAILTEEVIDNQIELNIYQCGGSLIHPKVVLTAAHCVFGKPQKALKARAGEWDTQTKNEILPHQDRFIAEIVMHDRFNRNTMYNDNALLLLTASFQLGENVRTICLPPATINFNDMTCVATGWGKDAYGKAGKYSNILKKVDLPIVSRAVCERVLRTTRLGKYFELHRSFVCAGGEEGKDTCKGDGGSPLACPIVGNSDRYYQAGIVAWGIGCGDNIPGVYANVAEGRIWIDRQMNHYGLDKKFYVA